VTLEGDEPSIVGPQAAPADVAPAPAPAGDEDAEPEGITIDLRGSKMVPLEALQAERGRRKEYQAQVKAAESLKAEVDALRGKAQTAEQVTAWVEQVRPLLEKLKGQPDLVKAIMSGQPVGQPQAPPEQAGPLSPEEAEDLARTMELYTAEGKPDLARAQKMAGKMAKLASGQAAAAMAPVTAAMAEGQSGTLRQQYAGLRDKAGRTVNPDVLQKMWQLVPSNLVAQDPNVAGVLYYAAKGYAAHHGMDEPAPPTSLPIVTEPAGGHQTAARALSDLDRRFARTMDSEKKYTETSARYKPGQINILED
jgi:hypothetical protein